MKKVTWLRLLLLATSSILLLWLGWLSFSMSFFLFIAFVPLLMLEASIPSHKFQAAIFGIGVYFVMFGWNLLTVGWIYDATPAGAISVFIINSFVLTLPFLVYYQIKKLTWPRLGLVSFILAWISMEYLHNAWPLAFPFLTLGNGLAKSPEMIQFYEYTGVLGGSIWVILSNITLFILVEDFTKRSYQSLTSHCITAIIVLALPVIASFAILNSYEDEGLKVEVVAIHPNLNNRNQKYILSLDSLVEHQFQLSKEKLTAETQYLIWPETAITNGGWIEQLNKEHATNRLLDKLAQYPNLKLITGTIVFEQYKKAHQQDPHGIPNLHFLESSNLWHFTYNAAIQIGIGESRIQLRTKEKLVPAEETIPFAEGFSFVRDLVPSLGGYLFSVKDKNDDIFTSSNPELSVAYLICYESIFGRFTANKVRKGATLLFIGLNEGWYRNTEGASQFMYGAVVRAIENRRSIARSSNDGISCFVSKTGEIISPIKDYRPTALRASISIGEELTFYTQYGDIIGVCSVVCLTFVLLYVAIRKNRQVKRIPAKKAPLQSDK